MNTSELINALSRAHPGVEFTICSDFATCTTLYKPQIHCIGDELFVTVLDVAKQMIKHPDCPSQVKEALEDLQLPTLQLKTCCQVSIQPGVESAWVGNFLESPSLYEIREAVKWNLGPGRSSNNTLLDVIDGIDPDHEQRLTRYKSQDQNTITLRSFTSSGRTCLGEICLSEGVSVICWPQTGDYE